LPCVEEEGGDDVTGVRVVAPGEGAADEVLGDVEVDEAFHGVLEQHVLDDVSRGNTTSATTDLPRPSNQLIADGFLSMQPFPEMDNTTFMSGNRVSWMVMDPNIDSRSRLRSLGDAGTLGVQ
jgi:hypothetical protein